MVFPYFKIVNLINWRILTLLYILLRPYGGKVYLIINHKRATARFYTPSKQSIYTQFHKLSEASVIIFLISIYIYITFNYELLYYVK